MLTCKSLFGLGYRGERLIEPSLLLRWLRVPPERAALVGAGPLERGRAGLSRRRDRQIAGTRRQAVGRAGGEETRPGTRVSRPGHPNNPTDRRDPQPSPTCLPASGRGGIRMQFTD